jgi:hypothetical protein
MLTQLESTEFKELFPWDKIQTRRREALGRGLISRSYLSFLENTLVPSQRFGVYNPSAG